VNRDVEFHGTIENRYKRSIAEIAKAATSCSLCEMVTELLKNCRRLADIAWVKPSIHVFGPEDFHVNMTFCTEEHVPVGFEEVIIQAKVGEGVPSYFPSYFAHPNCDQKSDTSQGHQRTTAKGGFVCSPSIHTLLQAQHMLDLCRKTHRRCREDAGEGWLPTRLIFVGSSENPADPRLITVSEFEASRRPTHYIAVSHRWGKVHFLMLDEKEKTTLRSSRQVFQSKDYGQPFGMRSK
jgi:hypothetical protein